MTEHRGSRMHVLDWVSSPDFDKELVELVRPIACTRDSGWICMPKGGAEDAEARLEIFGPEAFPEHAQTFRDLKSWWLAKGGNTPNWDIALRANIEGTPGLVLVEAKANHPELDNGPKTPFRLSAEQVRRLSPAQQAAAEQRSRENLVRIDSALAEATQALAATFPGIRLGRDEDYQLSNRVAFAWKIASQGIPVVLIYLGFTGDGAFGDRQLRDSNDWESAFRRHLATIGSPDFLERRIETVRAPLWVLLRAKKRRRISPPAMPRATQIRA